MNSTVFWIAISVLAAVEVAGILLVWGMCRSAAQADRDALQHRRRTDA